MRYLSGFNKIFAIVISCMFASSMVQAKELDLVNLYYDLNNSMSLQDMKDSAKKKFQTKVDHKWIDKDFKELSKQTKKWNWRFDVKRSGKIDFRVNGPVVSTMRVLNAEKQEYEINGQKFVFSSGLTYQGYKNQVNTLLNSKSAGLESLFINKAHAVGPLILLPFAFVAAAVSSENQFNAKPTAANRSNQTACFNKPHLPSIFGNRAAEWDRFVHSDFRTNSVPAGSCSSIIPRVGYKRLSLVAKNYKKNGKFRKGKASKQCAGIADIYQRAKCECKVRKMHSCTYGWNMSQQGAEKYCQAGLDIYYYCATGKPAAAAAPVANAYDPVTPCQKDKFGNYPAGCNASSNNSSCNVGKDGLIPPGCPGYVADPVTPGFNGKPSRNAEVDDGPSDPPGTGTYTPTQPSAPRRD